MRFPILLPLLLAAPLQAAMELNPGPCDTEFGDLLQLPSGLLIAGNLGGLFLSEDQGASWRYADLGLHDDPNAAIQPRFDAAERSDGSLVLVMEYAYLANADRTVFTRLPNSWPWALESIEASGDTLVAASSDQIFRSIDSGASWEMVWDESILWDHIHSLHLHPTDGTFVAHLERSGGTWLIVSEDGGATWEVRQIQGVSGTIFGIGFADDGRLWFGNDWQNEAHLRVTDDLGASNQILHSAPILGGLAVGPAGRLAMTTNSQILLSTDEGESFELLDTPFSFATPLCFTQEGTLLAGTDEAMYYSTDDGAGWSGVGEGFWSLYMLDADVGPDGVSWILGSRALWQDNGEGSWESVTLPGDEDSYFQRLRITESGRLLLFGRQSQGPALCYTSMNGGGSWESALGLGETTSWGDFTSISESGDWIWAGHETLGVFRSGDDGQSWESVNATANGRLALGGATLFLSGPEGAKFSVDEGASWSALPGISTGGFGAANPQSGAFVIPYWADLMRTPDNGETWTDIRSNAEAGLVDATLAEFGPMLYTPEGELLLSVQATNNLSYRRETRLLSSLDDGDNFTDVTEESWLRRAVIGHLKASAEGMAIACTNMGLFGNGYEPFVELAEHTLPQGLLLEASFPNPFNPATVIPFHLPTAMDARLDVYNLRGARVARLADGFLLAGRHQVDFHAAGLASGVYVYRLEAGGHSLQRSLLLLK